MVYFPFVVSFIAREGLGWLMIIGEIGNEPNEKFASGLDAVEERGGEVYGEDQVADKELGDARVEEDNHPGDWDILEE